MKLRYVATVLAAVALCAVFFGVLFGLGRLGVTGVANREGGSRDPSVDVASDAERMATHHRRESTGSRDPRLQAFFLSDFYKPKLDQLEAFLTRNDRSNTSLIAAYTVCEDQSLLVELLQTNPDETACQAVALWATDPLLHSEAIEHLKQLNPENPLPDLLQASGREKNLSTDEAVEIWKRVAEGSVLDLSSLRPTSLQLEAWESVTHDPVKAWAYFHFGSNAEGLAIWQIFSGMENLLAAAQNRSGFEVGEATSRFLAISNGLRGEAGNATEGDLLLHRVHENQLLQMIPPELEYGDQGHTVGDRIQQINQEIAESQTAFDELMNRLRNAEPIVVERFVEIWKADGQDRAIERLLNH